MMFSIITMDITEWNINSVASWAYRYKLFLGPHNPQIVKPSYITVIGPYFQILTFLVLADTTVISQLHTLLEILQYTSLANL